MAKKRGNGEGSIYYSEKLRRWIGQVSIGYKKDGSIRRKSVYGKTRKEVNEKMQKLVSNKDSVLDTSKYTLGFLIEKAITDEYNMNIVSAATYYRKKDTLRIVEKLDIYYMKVQKISLEDINKDLASLKDYSNSSISKVVQILRLGFKEGLRLEIINYSPFEQKGLILTPRSNKIDRKIDALTREEETKFINYLNECNDKYKDVFLIADFTGMRIGEILALTKEDIDFKNNLINVNKTLTKDENGKVILGTTTKTYAGTRKIPMNKYIHEIFSQIDKENELFLYKGNFISPTTINSHFKRICSKLGIYKCNAHMLRHTFATRCIESGMSPVVLQHILGHTDISITLNTYTSVFNSFKNEELEKYNEYLNGLH